jgi:hypothetical protein
MSSAEIISFPSNRRRTRARPTPRPDKRNALRVVQIGQWWPCGFVGGMDEPRELAKRYHQLAERCYRLAAIASELVVSEGFTRMGDDLAAKANYLAAKGGQESQTGAG